MAITPAAFATTGSVLTATEYNYLPRGVVQYSSKIADQTGITTEVDVSGLSVTWTATSTRYYKITAYCEARQNTSASNVVLKITDASNTLLQQYQNTTSAGSIVTPVISVILTGLSGSVTRKVRAVTGAGTLDILAGSTYPAFIVVEDLGIS